MFDTKKIEAEHSLEANFLKIRCQTSDRIDMIALKVIRNDKPEFLLPIRTIEVNNSLELRYMLRNQIALEYKNPVLKKEQFLHMYQNLIFPFVHGNDWMLDYHYFCIDMGHVYMEKEGTHITYMYVPVASCGNTDEEILDFLRKVLDKVTVSDDSSSLLKLYQSFSRENITLLELYEIVSQELAQISSQNSVISKTVSGQMNQFQRSIYESPKEVNLPINESRPIVKRKEAVLQQTADLSQPEKNFIENVFKKEEPKKRNLFGFMQHKKEERPAGAYEPKNNKVMTAEDEVVNALFGSVKKTSKKEEKGGNVNIQKTLEVKQKNIPVPDIQEILAVPANYDYTKIEEDSDVTEIEGGYEEIVKPHLELLSVGMTGLPLRIDLEFSRNQIMIGRQSNDSVQPDIRFAAQYRKVGRMHACIRKEKDAYYLVDLGSTNGTTLNGKVLVPNQPYLMGNQDEIGFVATDPIKYRVVL